MSSGQNKDSLKEEKMKSEIEKQKKLERSKDTSSYITSMKAALGNWKN